MRSVVALVTLLAAHLVTPRAALAASDCHLPTRAWEMWDVSGNPVTTGAVQVQTDMLVVEIAPREVAEFDIQWTDVLMAPFDRRTVDLRGVDSSHSQLIEALPPSRIAVGRLRRGRCLQDVVNALRRTTTAIASPGPRFQTSNDVPTRARTALFTSCFARVPQQYSAIDDPSSTIQLSARRLPDDAVRLELDSLIKFDPEREAAVALQGRASIESEGVVVLAALTRRMQSIASWRKGDVSVVLLFVQPTVR